MDHQKHSNNTNFLFSSSSSSITSTSPTTFVQADTHTFRELVQKLTGVDDNLQDKLPITLPSRYSSRSSSSSAATSLSSASPNDQLGGGVGGPRRSAFKLQERRQNMRKLEIKLGLTSIRNSSNSPTAAYSPREMQSYLVGSPIPSPVTPLGSDTVFSSRFSGSGSSSPASVVEEDREEKAIAEKGFYLHPSPLSTPRGFEPPELLPLFPLESPKQYRDL